MLNYHALYYLIEIAHAQSFSLAAENLHVTRPALSTAIKNLERDLGFSLLNRNPDGVSLTSQGEKVVSLAEQAFSYFDEIELLAKDSTIVPEDISVYSTQAINSSLLPALFVFLFVTLFVTMLLPPLFYFLFYVIKYILQGLNTRN